MPKKLLTALLLAFLGWRCQPKADSVTEELSVDSLVSETDSVDFTPEDQSNIQRLIQLTLLDQFKEDLALGLIDSLSRTYKYNQVDLNGDGDQEILVGMTGPFFCGSGGCTVLLLTSHGDVITRFSVVKYPAYLDDESSNGWKNLILYSGGANRVAQFDGTSYPANPSTLTTYSKSIDQLTKLLDWENLKMYSY
ncbi:hypothetical protein Aoki45_19770 [Algoriphagus sp. oki45]|uniref:hypothetical protein n=1 Tax=Algoriphagus sp. oki45 TaxID=3067294 RepID=UPI0027F2813A|nr:hypothetical protein Aoki45_19770 [Algoriphagus sp. oki45]